MSFPDQLAEIIERCVGRSEQEEQTEEAALDEWDHTGDLTGAIQLLKEHRKQGVRVIRNGDTINIRL